MQARPRVLPMKLWYVCDCLSKSENLAEDVLCRCSLRKFWQWEGGCFNLNINILEGRGGARNGDGTTTLHEFYCKDYFRWLGFKCLSIQRFLLELFVWMRSEIGVLYVKVVWCLCDVFPLFLFFFFHWVVKFDVYYIIDSKPYRDGLL